MKVSDTLTVIYAESNYIYYYDNELRINEHENSFKQTTNKGIKDVLQLYETIAKEKSYQFLVVLKIQKKNKLSKNSDSTIAFIKAKYKFKEKKNA